MPVDCHIFTCIDFLGLPDVAFPKTEGKVGSASEAARRQGNDMGWNHDGCYGFPDAFIRDIPDDVPYS
jgi:hypothetical protein